MDSRGVPRRRIIWSLLAVGLAVGILISALWSDAGEERDAYESELRDARREQGFPTPEIESTVRGAYQSELRDARSERRLDGNITVVSIDCAEERGPLVTCLAHVAATGEARKIVPAHAPIRVKRVKRGVFDYRSLVGP